MSFGVVAVEQEPVGGHQQAQDALARRARPGLPRAGEQDAAAVLVAREADAGGGGARRARGRGGGQGVAWRRGGPPLAQLVAAGLVELVADQELVRQRERGSRLGEGQVVEQVEDVGEGQLSSR
jgi:hypothetical protein